MGTSVPKVYWAVVLLGSTTLGKDRKQDLAEGVEQLCTHHEAASAGVEGTLQKSPDAVCPGSVNSNYMNVENYLPQGKHFCHFLVEKEASHVLCLLHLGFVLS